MNNIKWTLSQALMNSVIVFKYVNLDKNIIF